MLNALTMLQYGIERAKAFSAIDLFFDRDKAGLAATKDFLRALPYASDRSAAYEGFNDYNDKVKAGLDNMNASEVRGSDFFASVRVPFKR